MLRRWGKRLLPDRLEMLIAWRYVRRRRGDRFVSFVSLVSVLGIALGVAVLIVVVSVMNGFQSELRRRILGSVPHVVVQGEVEASRLAAVAGVGAVGRFVEVEAMLGHDGTARQAGLFGIEPEREAEFSIVAGHVPPRLLAELAVGGDGVVLGRLLARELGVVPGDRVLAMLPVLTGRGRLRPVPLSLRVLGVFEVGAEVDAQLALLDWRTLAAVDGVEAGWRLRVDDLLRAPEVARRIRAAHPRLQVSDWGDRYGDLFRTVRMEKAMMFVLLVLSVGIAAFNVVSGLAMLVQEKRGEVAILGTLGMSAASVARVFVWQGAMLGTAGTLLGVAAGCAAALHVAEIVGTLELLFGSAVLGGSYFTQVPSELRGQDVAMIAAAGFLLGVLATLPPARQAARLLPARVLGGV